MKSWDSSPNRKLRLPVAYFALIITLALLAVGCATPSSPPENPDAEPISKGPSGTDFSFLETKSERGEFD
jgi:hypothetical protein